MRHLVLLLAVGCSSPKAPATKAGRIERLQIGNLEAFVLADGSITLPNNGKTFGLGLPTTQTGDVLAAAGLPRDPVHLDIDCLLVKAGDRAILFDTGAGNASWADAGRLLPSLALAGVEPIAITDIFISHAHGDHIGGIVTKAGTLAFPSATIHMSTLEWAYMREQTDADSKREVSVMTPKVVPFEPGAQILPMVKSVATIGHTPGHESYEIGIEGEKLFYLGDVAHHSVISVQHPAWSIEFDVDRPAAEAMRQQTLAKLATDKQRVFAVHFPFPGIGHITGEGDALTWKPEH